MSPASCRVLAVALLLSAFGCSDPSSSVPSTSVATTTPPDSSASSAALPRVDLVSKAVSALETRLGAPQQYFEINATARLVNLFVALNEGKVVQPWVYLDGELSSTEGHDASGFTFAGKALDYDPDKVLSHIEAELPQSKPDAFIIEGGAAGSVQYTVTVTSPEGGQLVVVVGPDGVVKSVDA